MVEEKKEKKEVKEVKEVKKEEKKVVASEDKKAEVSKRAPSGQKLKDIIGAIEKMTLMEISELVKALEEKFGVSATAPVMVAASGAASNASKEAAEEKSSFEVVLTAIGDKKIQVIKELRTVTTLGLKEAKDLVDKAPQTVKKDVSKKEAEEIKKKLEAAGGKVEIK